VSIMKIPVVPVIAVPGAIIVAVLVTELGLSRLFSAKVDDLRRRLLASQVCAAPDQSLIPQLVRDFAARNGGRLGGASAVRMVQSAEMRLKPDQAFFHINATQLSGAREPGFVWQAAGTMAAIVPLQVVDSYVAGAGWLEARIAGAIPVASARGPEIDKSEAMRFLAELAWNPDAMINASGLSWRPVDSRTVEVSMTTRGGPARVRLLFDAAGDITGIEADDRPGAIGKLPAPWIGRFSDYVRIGAYRWPRQGEIAWTLPAGEFVYWRGEIVSIIRADAR
jgi:hypothetical protein